MSDTSPQSLYNSTLNELCHCMSEEMMQYILKWYPPIIVFEVIWKILHLTDDNEGFGKRHSYLESLSAIRGQQIATMESQNLDQTYDNISPIPKINIKEETHKVFAKFQQTKFIDNCNFCNNFDLNLFFKLVDCTKLRHKLFTIFQIVIQKKGFQFPKQLSEEWINSEKQNDTDEMHLIHIEHGLKLGIFLGDSGWLNESALVLSYTYDIISTKWVCHDQNFKLMKIIQCLTKWLLAVSIYHNFDEARVVLQHLLHNMTIIENTEGRTLCIAYAYIAVSQYYYVLMEFNEAWSWTVKAVNELHDKSGDALKLLVIGHAIRVCSALNKLSTARKLIDQLLMYDKHIEQNIYVDMLLSEACYSLKADLALDSIRSYYVALDSRRNLFGYYNLNTAIVFFDYAYARYVCDYSTTEFSEATRCISQAIFIMKKIGVPSDNMLLVNAGRIKALILEERALDVMDNSIFGQEVNPDDRLIDQYKHVQELRKSLLQSKTSMLDEAEALHLKALEVSLKAVGEKTLHTAKTYCNLGRLYQSQDKFMLSEKMHLKAIEIKESILGKDDPEVALSLGHLASLYTYQLRYFRKAEQLYLRSKKIYEITYGRQYTGLLYDLQGLAEVYQNLNESAQYDRCKENIAAFKENRDAWLHQVHAAVDQCTKDDLSLEKFKCILNDVCICDKK